MNTIQDILCQEDFIFTRKGKENCYYLNLPLSFDIETSSFYNENNEKRATMYIYVLGIKDKVKFGRTWEEFLNDCNEIKKYYNLDDKHRAIIYVHNLAYEFQFIRKLFSWDNVLSLSDRTPITALTTIGIEFRCSYILSGYSLAKVAEHLHKHNIEKLKGDLDYQLIRTSITPITKEELKYVENDGLIVLYYIAELIEECGSIVDIPLTKTGFVRKLCRKNTIQNKEAKYYSKNIRKLTMSIYDYTELLNAFQGGFTHANYLNAKMICKNVSSYDFTSSYPYVLISEKYPMSEAKLVNIRSKEHLHNMLKEYCCLFEIIIKDVEPTFYYESYISYSRVIRCEEPTINNGRIMCAKSIDMIITEVDFNILVKTYKWSSMEIKHFKIYKKDYLPTDFIKVILELYKSKTELKGVKGKEIEYMRSKEQLNSCYGMCATDPCKDRAEYIDNIWTSSSLTPEEAINQYNNSKSRFLYYPWGVWCTAYARRNLWTAIYTIGNDYIYSDTDSVKIMHASKYKEYFKKYNDNVIKKLHIAMDYHKLDYSLCSPKSLNGKVKTMGLWDYEGTYDYFKTIGAKRYIYSKGDNLYITISGVNKKNGVDYLLHKYKTPLNAIKHFNNGLVFPSSYINKEGKEVSGTGKLTHTYIDEETKGEVIDYMGNRGEYHELSSIHMEPAAYSLSLASDYLKLLQRENLKQK